MSRDMLKMDESKLEAIWSWSQPKSIHGIMSFHGLASLYQRFIKGFSTIITPFTECLKRGVYKWNKEAQKSFELI